jgi:hypothetical protein
MTRLKLVNIFYAIDMGSLFVLSMIAVFVACSTTNGLVALSSLAIILLAIPIHIIGDKILTRLERYMKE